MRTCPNCSRGGDFPLKKENEMKFDIIPLPKEKWKGTVIPMFTRSDSYYDMELWVAEELRGKGLG